MPPLTGSLTVLRKVVPSSLRRWTRLTGPGVAALLAGCVFEPARIQSFSIAGGETVSLPMGSRGAMPAENADVKIEVAGYMVDGGRQEIIYTFGITVKQGGALRAVKIEDVTGPVADVLVDDLAPRVSPRQYWIGNAAPRRREDPGLEWLLEPGNTTKVFRFSFTTADGREFVLHQASVWDGRQKPTLRRLLGLP